MLQRVGRFEIQERIGHGAMADVYRAYDPTINRVLAIKVLKPEFCQNREYVARFVREAKAAGALSHPNIVTIFDVGEEVGAPYIAMELLDGEPLDAVVARRRQLPPQEVAAIGLQLAEALHYAHGLGVVHRDIKPSNILLLADGASLKILDFGIARVNEADPESHDAEASMTQVGQILGTPRYMSPEQALGRELDGRSDLFSTGVVLYELLTGAKAFSGATAVTLALQITQQDPEPIVRFAPRAPAGLQFIITKLLAKRPERRFVDGAHLAEALRREQAAYAPVRDAKRRNLPLQLRLTLVMALITATALAVSIGAVLNREHRAMEEMALTSGSAMASFVASNAALSAAENAALPPAERDWLPVQAFIKAAAADRNIQALTVVDGEGRVRAASDPRQVGRTYIPAKGEAVVERGPTVIVTRPASAGGAEDFRFVRPIVYAGHAFGVVDVRVSGAPLQSAVTLSKWLMAGLAWVVLAVVMAASFVMAHLLAEPIRRLRKAMEDATGGDLDFRISHHRKDEFGELFNAYNNLSEALHNRLQTLGAAAGVRSVDQSSLTPAAVASDVDLDQTQIAPLVEAQTLRPTRRRRVQSQ
ncbi:MAG: protein kinase [Phenylobacterium sp.]|uniref:protein kinase domain-containing protein n=1 Tax=Phenylobacterium sp. TaxID=1871053 RepID=UPI0027332688|nr:protein kinase [Phenylobacterium sp.]MDP3175887.1 protein kinase [Phenylobacterium sp.]